MAQPTFRLAALLLGFALGAKALAADALLPMVDTVPPGQALAIDGVWTVASLGKRVRVEKGRIVVVDPWRHLFVLKVRAGMVVVKDIRDQGQGIYGGYDLMAVGSWRATKNASGNLDVELGGLVPSRFQMLPVQLDNPGLYQQVPVATASNPYATPNNAQPATSPAPPSIPAASPEYPTLPGSQPQLPTQPQLPAAAPAPAPATPGGMTCREVVYQEATDNFKCVQ